MEEPNKWDLEGNDEKSKQLQPVINNDSNGKIWRIIYLKVCILCSTIHSIMNAFISYAYAKYTTHMQVFW